MRARLGSSFFSICVLFINSRKQTNPFSILGSASRKQHCTERKLSKTHINARCYARKIFNFSLILTFIVFMHMNVFRKCIKIETRNKFYSFSNLRKSNKYFAFIHRLEKIPRLFISDFFLNQIIWNSWKLCVNSWFVRWSTSVPAK